jgi:hypothetical protein
MNFACVCIRICPFIVLFIFVFVVLFHLFVTWLLAQHFKEGSHTQLCYVMFYGTVLHVQMKMTLFCIWL